MLNMKFLFFRSLFRLFVTSVDVCECFIFFDTWALISFSLKTVLLAKLLQSTSCWIDYKVGTVGCTPREILLVKPALLSLNNGS